MSTANRHIVLILCFLLGSIAVALAQEADSIPQSSRNITNEAYYIEDPQGSLTLKEATDSFSHGKAIHFNSSFVNFGNSDSYFWIQVDLKPDSIGERYLVIPYPALELLDIYTPTGSLVDSLKFKIIETGFSRPFDNRAISHYFYSIRVSQPGKYYLRFHSVMGSVFPIMLYDRANMDTTDSWLNVYNGFYVGIVFFILLSALAYFILFKENIYFFYALYIANTLMVVTFINGWIFRFVFVENVFVREHPIMCFLTLAQISFQLFLLNFLSLKSNNRRLYITSYVFIGLIILEVPLDLLGYHYQSILLATTISFFHIIFGIIAPIYIMIKGIRQARFILLGSIALAFGVGYQIFAYFGLFNYNMLALHGTEIGSMLEMLFFSIAMIDRSYRDKKGREEEIKEKMVLLEQNDLNFRKQNKELEKMIDEKTRVLAAQNELLKLKNDELVSQSRKTREQNEIIERQNRMLIEQSAKLQQDMENRTGEIIKANEQLQYKNIQLEQFAFITSHNIRGPIARMIGLTNIFDINKMDTEMNKTVIEKMKVCSAELDEIITDLTSIIAVQKGVDRIVEPVQISQLLRNIINTFEQQIIDFGIDIKFDVATADRIISVKAYIHSIIYNLLSNAIKYRNTNVVLQINITSFPLGNDKIIITFSDNGIGMDLDKIRDKLFKPFQRFNDTLPGKGLGLYLIKTQVESLGGDIRIESALDLGTTFFIELPYIKVHN
jgi:signal transduction histidine kinase